eukprot:7255931-Alexandrium_andersonii.AAC.1
MCIRDRSSATPSACATSAAAFSSPPALRASGRATALWSERPTVSPTSESSGSVQNSSRSWTSSSSELH